MGPRRLFSTFEYWFFRRTQKHKSLDQILGGKWPKFAEKPGVKLEMRLQLLKLLKSRGDEAGSLRVANECLELVRAHDLPYGNRYQALCQIADTYHWCDDIMTALSLWEEAWLMAKGNQGEWNEITVRTMERVAFALRLVGNVDRAIELQRAALGYWLSTEKATSQRLRYAEGHLGISLKMAGQNEEAIEVLERALDRSSEPGPEDLVTSQWLASALDAVSDYDRAIELDKRALAELIRTLGRDHEHTQEARENLAIIYWNARDLSSAVHLLEEKLEIIERANGSDDPDAMHTRELLIQIRDEMTSGPEGSDDGSDPH
jgi:tetratricopeptide (TPR) repeat protein